MKQKRVLILTYYYHPCTETMLENVMAKEMGKLCEIVWFHQGDISAGKVVQWHNTRVNITSINKGNGLIAKLINRAYGYLKVLKMLASLIKHKADIVMVRDLPLESCFLLLLRPLFKFKLYYQHSAPLGEGLIAYSKLPTTSDKIFVRLQGFFYLLLLERVLKRADMIFPITEFHKTTMAETIPANRLVAISMGVDEDWLQRRTRSVPSLEVIKQDHHLIGYVGTLSFLRNPKFMLDVFARVVSRYQNCKFLIMGKTATATEQRALDNYCKALQIQDDVIFTGHLDRDSLHDRLTLCDLTISLIPPVDFYIISSPTKMYESLGASVPVVANEEIHEQRKVINESKGGILTPYEVAPAADAVIQVLSDKGKRETMAVNGRRYVIAHYSYSSIAKRIAPLFL